MNLRDTATKQRIRISGLCVKYAMPRKDTRGWYRPQRCSLSMWHHLVALHPWCLPSNVERLFDRFRSATIDVGSRVCGETSARQHATRPVRAASASCASAKVSKYQRAHCMIAASVLVGRCWRKFSSKESGAFEARNTRRDECSLKLHAKTDQRRLRLPSETIPVDFTTSQAADSSR